MDSIASAKDYIGSPRYSFYSIPYGVYSIPERFYRSPKGVDRIPCTIPRGSAGPRSARWSAQRLSSWEYVGCLMAPEDLRCVALRCVGGWGA
eukprot:7559583-Pyramimonas_sp.AAC.1